MTENNAVAFHQKDEIDGSLTEILRSGARRLIKQAVEAEFAAFLASHGDLKLPDGRQRVVRHGHDPVRPIQTGIGPVEVEKPKARDRGALSAEERFPLFVVNPADMGAAHEDGVQPRSGGRREVEGPAWMIGEPLHHSGMFMRRVIVEGGMDDLACRHGALDGGKEADELPMAMLLHAAADDDSVQNIERGEQGGRAVSLVIVDHGPAFSGFERQAGLCAVERLDLALLIDGDHDGVSRRVHVEANDILDLLGELWIGRPLECSDAMLLEAMLLPEALHRPQRNPHDLRHGAARPMSGRWAVPSRSIRELWRRASRRAACGPACGSCRATGHRRLPRHNAAASAGPPDG